jgi:hypothetical protein
MPGSTDAHLRRAQQPVVDHEAFGHDLDDLAGLGAGHGRLEHRLMQLRVEGVARLRGRWARCRACLKTLVSSRMVSSTAPRSGPCPPLRLSLMDSSAREAVVDRQHVAGELGAAVLLGLAAVAFARLRRVLGVGERAHEAVAHLVAFGPGASISSSCRTGLVKLSAVLLASPICFLKFVLRFVLGLLLLRLAMPSPANRGRTEAARPVAPYSPRSARSARSSAGSARSRPRRR